jgi:hypothetical protein
VLEKLCSRRGLFQTTDTDQKLGDWGKEDSEEKVVVVDEHS